MASDFFNHRAVCFWSWNGDMEVAEVEEQMRQFSAGCYGGVIVHARAGLTIPYMGDAWFTAYEAVLNAAEKYNMEVWMYDEDGWPSGFAGGKVNALGEDYLLKRVGYGFAPPTDVRCRRLAAYRKTGEAAFVRIPYEEAAEGDLCFWYTVEPHYVDLLDARVTAAFIEHTHEVYKRHIGDRFGTVVKGIFTDEPQLHTGGITWSNVLEDAYRKAYGRDLLDELWLLLVAGEGYRTVRREFWELIGRLMENGFSRQLGEWCEKNGIMLTGHFAAEDGLCDVIASNGGVMPHYRHFQLPGIDHLGSRCATPVLMKQTASVSNQFGNGEVLSETSGCSGWGVSFRRVCWTWGWQSVLGITKPCYHLAAYSIRGVRKRDYPAFFSYQTPWWDQFADLNKWVDGLNALMKEGTRDVRVLVIPPVRGAMSEYRGEQKTSDAVRRFSNEYRLLLENLIDVQVDFELGDERLLATDGAVQTGQMCLGRGRYDLVFVCEGSEMAGTTVALLKEFVGQGGRLVFVNTRPSYVDGQPSEALWALPAWDIKNRRDLLVKYFLHCGWKRPATVYCGRDMRLAGELALHTRRLDGALRTHIWNGSRAERRDVQVAFDGCVSVYRVDPATGERTLLPCRFDGCDTYASLTLCEMDNTVLETGVPCARVAAPRLLCETAVDPTVRIESRNSLTLDRACYSINGSAPSDEQPVLHVVDALYRSLAKTEGDADFEVVFTYRFACEQAAALSDMTLAIEDVGTCAILCNGVSLEGRRVGWFVDKSIAEYDLSGLIKDGENTVDVRYIIPRSKVRVLPDGSFETEGNRFFYLVEPESVYINGTFDVRAEGEVFDRGRSLSTEGRYTLVPATPKEMGDLTRQGLWFYRGHAAYEFTVSRPAEGRLAVAVQGVEGIMVEVCVGEHRSALFVSAFECDITPWLSDGDNTVTVRLIGSNRNLLGPHHHVLGETDFTGNSTFKGVRGFEDFINHQLTEPSTWTDRYGSVPFGLAGITLRHYSC